MPSLPYYYKLAVLRCGAAEPSHQPPSTLPAPLLLLFLIFPKCLCGVGTVVPFQSPGHCGSGELETAELTCRLEFSRLCSPLADSRSAPEGPGWPSSSEAGSLSLLTFLSHQGTFSSSPNLPRFPAGGCSRTCPPGGAGK